MKPGEAPITSGSIPFELELLSRSVRYQEWMADTVTPFLGQRILEVGSGIGNLSKWLPCREKLVLSEAEELLLPFLRKTVHQTFGENPKVEVHPVDLSMHWEDDFAPYHFDTVVSFNVLEHIEEDQKALAQLLSILNRSHAKGPKRLITLVPAHRFAFGTIDQTYAHFRRYSRSDFRRMHRALAQDWKMNLRHFNVIGLPSWILMGRLLKKKAIGVGAVRTFEAICPWVRGIDDFLHKKLQLPLGQSLVCVWEKPAYGDL